MYLWIELNDSSFNFWSEGELLQILDSRLLAKLDLLWNVGWQVMASILGQLTDNAGSVKRSKKNSEVDPSSSRHG